LPRRPRRIVRVFGLALEVAMFISFVMTTENVDFICQVLGLAVCTCGFALLE
jgi:hypothetical protein